MSASLVSVNLWTQIFSKCSISPGSSSLPGWLFHTCCFLLPSPLPTNHLSLPLEILSHPTEAFLYFYYQIYTTITIWIWHLFFLIMEGNSSYQMLSLLLSHLTDLASAHNLPPALSISPSLLDDSHKLTISSIVSTLIKKNPYFMNCHLSQPLSFQVDYHLYHDIYWIFHQYLIHFQCFFNQVTTYPWTDAFLVQQFLALLRQKNQYLLFLKIVTLVTFLSLMKVLKVKV